MFGYLDISVFLVDLKEKDHALENHPMSFSGRHQMFNLVN